MDFTVVDRGSAVGLTFHDRSTILQAQWVGVLKLSGLL
jgi:hypothetical protein